MKINYLTSDTKIQAVKSITQDIEQTISAIKSAKAQITRHTNHTLTKSFLDKEFYERRLAEQQQRLTDLQQLLTLTEKYLQ